MISFVKGENMPRKFILMMVCLWVAMLCTASLAATSNKKPGVPQTKAELQKNIGYRYVVNNEDASVIIFAKEALSAVSQSERKDYPAGTMMLISEGKIRVIPPEYLRLVLNQYTKSEETISIISQYLKEGPQQENNNLVLKRDCRNPMPLSTLLYLISGYGESGSGLDLENGTLLSPSICLAKP